MYLFPNNSSLIVCKQLVLKFFVFLLVLKLCGSVFVTWVLLCRRVQDSGITICPSQDEKFWTIWLHYTCCLLWWFVRWWQNNFGNVLYSFLLLLLFWLLIYDSCDDTPKKISSSLQLWHQGTQFNHFSFHSFLITYWLERWSANLFCRYLPHRDPLYQTANVAVSHRDRVRTLCIRRMLKLCRFILDGVCAKESSPAGFNLVISS
jgi:hypothetical protein